MSKTVREIADEIGVSKTAIRKYFDDAFRASYVSTTQEGSLVVSDEGCAKLRELLHKHIRIEDVKTEENPQETAENGPKTAATDPVSAQLIALLQEQLAAKDRQIEALNASLERVTESLTETTKSLQAAQMLHAGTQQQLLEDGEQASKKRHWWSKK